MTIYSKFVIFARDIFLILLVYAVSDKAAFAVVGGVTHLSLPSLAEPGSVRKAPPVPPRRRKSYMSREQECVDNSDNCVSSIATSELLENSRKANSSEDIQTACTKSDPCLCENNNIHGAGIDSSVGGNSFSVDYMLTADTREAVSTNQRTEEHTGFVPPVKPLRHNEQAQELPVRTCSSDVAEIADSTVNLRLKIESANKCESSTEQEEKATFPQPKPRISLLRNSIVLGSDEADQVARKQSHNESDMQNTSNAMGSPCPDSKSDTPQIMPVADGAGTVKMNEAEQLLDCQKLTDYTSSNEQNHLKVQSDASVEVQRSSFIVPSRTAPSPPLPISIIVTQPSDSKLPSRVAPTPPVPKPKIRKHSSGLSEAVKHSCNSDVSESKASSDTDNVSDSIPTSSVSGKSVNEENQQLGNDEVYLPDSLPPRDSDSDDSNVFYPISTSSIHTSVVSSPTVPAAVYSLAKVDESSKKKGPAVAIKRKPTPACRRSLYTTSDIRNENSQIPHTRRQSEIIPHGSYSSSLNSSSTDAAPKPYPRQDVIPRFANLSLTGAHETAADMQKNLSPRESCSSPADAGSVSARSLLEPPVSPMTPMSPGINVADTPPITPAAFAFDGGDEEARKVCRFLQLTSLIISSVHPWRVGIWEPGLTKVILWEIIYNQALL